MNHNLVWWCFLEDHGKMLSLKDEQYVNMIFLIKLHGTHTGCFQMRTTAYGNDCLFCARVFEWHKRFSAYRGKAEDDERPGRPCSSRTEEKTDIKGVIITAVFQKQQVTVIIIEKF